jgi:exopolysaccharide production protein ExoQ
MPKQLALLLGVCLVLWMLWRDIRARSAGSWALFIPAFYLCIICSRPLGYWFGMGAANKVDGSPFDRFVFLTFIVFVLVVLARRALNWGLVISKNPLLFLVLAYLMVSTFWAYHPLSSFKRWTKLVLGVLVALFFLTEQDPARAIRTIFVRCSYIFLPLSVVTGKYYIEIGMVQAKSWKLMLCGLAEHKNSLGRAVMVFGLMMLWDYLETRKRDTETVRRALLPNYVAAGLCGVWLLVNCQSQTALLSFMLGAVIFWSTARLLRARQPAKVVWACLATAGVLVLMDQLFGVSDLVFQLLGRDKTLTGRTAIWEHAVDTRTDPLLGCGYYGFWDSPRGEEVLEYIVITQSHNGYLETYLDGGLIGLSLLSVLLITNMIGLTKRLFQGDYWSRISFTFGIIVLLYNFSEADFFREESLWLTYLLATIQLPGPLTQAFGAAESEPDAPDVVSAEAPSSGSTAI